MATCYRATRGRLHYETPRLPYRPHRPSPRPHRPSPRPHRPLTSPSGCASFPSAVAVKYKGKLLEKVPMSFVDVEMVLTFTSTRGTSQI